MNNIYEKYWCDDNLRARGIRRYRIVTLLYTILWLCYFVCIGFFAKKLEINTHEHIVTFICVTSTYVLTWVGLIALQVLDAIKKYHK